jgi:glycosyltransferase involved in cell wall biosynthesis
MPPILIDISRLLSRRLLGRLPTGIDRVALAYLSHYRANARAVLCLGSLSWVLSRKGSERAFDLLLNVRPMSKLTIIHLWVEALSMGWLPSPTRWRLLFNTGHMGLQHANYARSLRRRGTQLLCVVHDLIPITHPEYCRPGRRDRHLRRMRNIVNLSCGVIVNSRDTMRSLESFCAQSQLTRPTTVIAPLATELPALKPNRTPLRKPFFVILGNIEPRKNHWMLLQLWRRLVERSGNDAPRLVIVGQRGWECENVIDLLERCEQLRGHVMELSRCGDEELVNLLQHACALLYPSFAEGYGLPIAEALSLGAPVIASDLPVFREFAEEIPEYADPLDGRRWLELIEDYARPESNRRAAQIERLRSFSNSTWAQHFKKVDCFVTDLTHP